MNKREIIEAAKAWNPATGYPGYLDDALHARAKALGPKGAADGLLAKTMSSLAGKVREYLEFAREEERELRSTSSAIAKGETLSMTPTTFARPRERLSFLMREQVAAGQRAFADVLELYEAMAPEANAPGPVTWIVTDGNEPDVCANGEFGVLVDGRPYVYYKGPTQAPSDKIKFRPINKREFGEVIRRPEKTGETEET